MLGGSRHQRSVAERRAGEELLLGIGLSANLSLWPLVLCLLTASPLAGFVKNQGCSSPACLLFQRDTFLSKTD
jgi:hypothetical protein